MSEELYIELVALKPNGPELVGRRYHVTINTAYLQLVNMCYNVGVISAKNAAIQFI